MTASGAPLCDLVIQAARRHPRRICLTEGDRTWTFAAFMADVDALAAELFARFARGDRIALFMANSAEYLLLQFAIERAGLVRIPLNARFTSREVGTVLADSGAAACIHDASTAERTAPLRAELPGIWWCAVTEGDRAFTRQWRGLLASDRAAPRGNVDLDQLASINYTSGTSGTPKGAMLTHRCWAAVCRNMLIDRDIRADDVLAHVGPLTHASGTYFVPWFLRGAQSVLIEGGSVDGLLDAVEWLGVTVFTCVPTFLTRLVNQPGIDRRDLSSLRAVGYGAEPIPSNTLDKAIALFGPILTQNYGLTEAMMTVATLDPAGHFVTAPDGGRTIRSGAIGRPYTFVDVVLRAPDGTPVADGEVGEITIRSDHVMHGYWNRPDETEKVLRDGWLWSGDLARIDGEGYIILAGRSKDMLISGGFNIYPAEVEAVLTGHPDVLEAAVVGIPDPDWGEVALAFVTPVAGARIDAAGLTAFAKPILGIKLPKHFRILQSLPKNANGKVDKPQLKAAAQTEFQSHA